MSRNYLAYYENEWPANIAELTAIENKPFVGYLKGTGVQYTVIPKPEQPSLYEAVDLGLPSGLKWADRLVGASAPGEPGLYFQWGDTVGYTKEQVGKDKVFDWVSYFDTTDGGNTFNKYNNNGGLTQLESVDDAATQNMGSNWRMPTDTELRELINNTTPTFIDLQGNEFTQSEAHNGEIEYGNLKGIRLTGSNRNSIFIPACGNCEDDIFYGTGEYSYLWSSSLGNYAKSSLSGGLHFHDSGDLSAGSNMGRRSLGNSVLGVKA